MKLYLLGALVALFLFNGCSTKEQTVLQENILSPESVEIYDVSTENVFKEVHNGRKLLKGFPFISNEAIIDFNGKFSDQFYDKIDYRYKFSAIKDVDFWKLRVNPFSEDFIYVLPTWVNEFKRVSNDLFTNIGYTYNLSNKEQEILKWWIGEGGIMWIEGGIYSTRYDTFNKNGEINHKKIKKRMVNKSKNLKFFDKKIKSYMTIGKKVDYINYVPLKHSFKTKSNISYFSDIKNLDLVSMNFMSEDFMPKAKTLLATTKGEPVASFVQYGKGGVVFLRPFEFKDKMYDGELLRWKLMYYLMNKMYLEEKKEVVYKTVAIQKPMAKKSFTLHNLHFAYKSYQLKRESKKNLIPIVDYMSKRPNTNVKVIGHTDNIGSRHYNNNLSNKRAGSVKDALVQMGIESRRITSVGHGEDFPIKNNTTENGRALNRRVEFIISER
jgi:outer membrane protein OmpA-like peptidoglycan-associated protein